MTFITGLRCRLRLVASRRTLIKQHAHLLRPGLWKVTRLTPRGGSADARLCRHVRRGTPPAHLAEVKFAHMARGQWLGMPTMVRNPRDVVAALAHLPLSLVWVSGRRAQAPTYSLLVPASDDVLLMDPAEGVTHRVLRTPVTDTQIEVRERLASHVPTAHDEVGPHGRWLREELVGGRSFGALPPAERSACFARLVERYTGLIRDESGVHAMGIIESALDAASTARLDADLARRLTRRQDHLQGRASLWPTTPSHGNLNGGNFVVRDRTAVLIDLKLCDELPFFHDLLFLAAWEASMGRADLVDGLLDGTHDASLAALWAAAGLPFDATELSDALMAVALVNAHHRTVTHPSDDERSFADHLSVVTPVLERLDDRVRHLMVT